MRLTEIGLQGAFLVDLEPSVDERGFFARAFCLQEFEAAGLNTHWVQHNIAFNRQRGTLRGIHYQCAPHAEIKLVRCTAGALCDIIVDLRLDSPTYCQWIGVELSADNRRALYIPEGFGQGFQTLADNTEVYYHMGAFYHPECARGVRWNDQTFAIDWPLTERIVSERDELFPDWIK